MLSNARRKSPKFRNYRGNDTPSSPVWICVWLMAAVTYLGSSYYYSGIASMNDHAAIGAMPNLVDAAFVLLPPRPSESEPVLEALRQWGAKNPQTPLVVSHSHARDMELLRAAHAGTSYYTFLTQKQARIYVCMLRIFLEFSFLLHLHCRTLHSSPWTRVRADFLVWEQAA